MNPSSYVHALSILAILATLSVLALFYFESFSLFIMSHLDCPTYWFSQIYLFCAFCYHFVLFASILLPFCYHFYLFSFIFIHLPCENKNLHPNYILAHTSARPHHLGLASLRPGSYILTMWMGGWASGWAEEGHTKGRETSCVHLNKTNESSRSELL